MDISDATLLQRWQRSSDSEAFATIVARHSAMVFTTCNRILRNSADAEDVTQECFMELGGVRRLVGNSLGGLLHTLATHRSLDRLKRESRRREREIRYAMGRPTSCTVGWDDIYPHIDEAIANLPMKYRDAIIQHFLEGQTHAEISSAMAVAESTVRYRITKGIERVRTELHRRGVIVSTDAMGNVLGESNAEAVSAALAANLGKLAVAGARRAPSTTVTRPFVRQTLAATKVFGIIVVAAFAGLFVWRMKTDVPPVEAPPKQVTSLTPVAPIEAVDAATETDRIALDEQAQASPSEPATEEVAASPPVALPEAGIDVPESEVITSDEVAPEPMPETVTEVAIASPPVESSDTEKTIPEKDRVALVEPSQDPMRTPITDQAAMVPPIESPKVEEPWRGAPSEAQSNDSLPESEAITVASAMEPIQIELPEAFFGGTPLDYWGPNLEEEDYKDRPPFLAPGGTTIISAGKPVIASSEPTVGTLTQLTDGDKDYAKTSLLELPEGIQWVQIDFEKTSQVYAVLVWHFHEGKRVYFDLVAQVSDDPSFNEGVTTIYNNDFDNSAGLGVGEDKEYIESNKGRLIDAKGVKGRYLRVYGKGSTASDFNHFIEVEVWGN